VLRLIALWVALAAAVVGAPGAAAAQQTGLPRDVGGDWGATEAAPELPEPPEGYRTEDRGGVQWTYPASAEEQAHELQTAFDEAWTRLMRDLGTEVERNMVLRIARGPEDMRRLAPEGHPPPRYASGVAYPAFGVILLTLTAPETWKRPDMDELLTHELSHIALRRAVRGHPLPRWFVEGVAIHQAEEHSLARTRALWEASVGGNLIPLAELSDRFPAQPHQVNLAYAQSADIVRHLRDTEQDARRFRELIENLREGEDFGAALRGAYFISPNQLEQRWRGALSERYQGFPLLLGGGTVWALAVLVLVVGYIRKRRRHHRKLAEMEREERAAEPAATPSPAGASLAPVGASASQAQAQAPPSDEQDDERMVVFVSGDPPQGREPDVPTIEYEGSNHTLH
jgi:hypothetical protein